LKRQVCRLRIFEAMVMRAAARPLTLSHKKMAKVQRVQRQVQKGCFCMCKSNMKAGFARQVKTYSCWENLQLGKSAVVIAFVPPE